ncbi:endo-b-N-acetylglucosaminidase [Mucor mucedo]|uniref:endo-b-N-acetylglucosaminidase n=1 Tax=Mucor mucedo TaxID=29922 RepID=UPI00221E8228|nr:endo-b-N-acetylglucosaminidase [Mucor mucedo]KAI7894833.1 endo-b-N-acetylglucosaminidase [Mucor mucedo]
MPSSQLLQDQDKLLPVSFALESINELRDWTPEATEYNIPNVPLQPRAKDPLKPRLLLTHDMAGGYNEDKSIQGNAYSDIYHIQYWHLTDIFVYFSHKRVSIPPVNWTNACHRNGVKCLGTFLVEGSNQMHEMEALLQGPPLVKGSDDGDPMRLWSPFYADKLVAIAKHYGFDGWLFNIECEFFPFPTNPRTKAEELAKFLHYLTEKMHQEIPGSQVIWYDSMTQDGDIDWQNNLTVKNELFFQNTDGIFINYWWKKEYPESARQMVEKQGRAGIDLYFGTDVWGRGTFGGGGFQSYKGVKVASGAQASSALFGMAWTYEHFGKADFEKMDHLFWCGGDYSDYPPPSPKMTDKKTEIEIDDSEDEMLHGHRKGISDTVTAHSVPGLDWFVTSFDRGFGNRFYYRGKRLISQPWSHLSHQAVLPNLDYRDPHIYPIDKNTKFSSSLESNYGAFTGGTSLIIRGQRTSHRESRDTEFDVTVPLYKLSVDASKGCTLKYIYRTLLTEDVKLTMSCDFLLKTSAHATSTDFFSSWQPESSLDQEDGFRATITTADDASESRCFLLPATEQATGENEWITKTIHIPAAPVGNAIFINKIGVSVTVNAASLVGLTPHVIASLGYLSIIPGTTVDSLTQMNETKLIDLTWTDQEAVAKIPVQEDMSEILPEEVYVYYGSLNWKDVTKDTHDWKETEFYIISYQFENCDISFLGTSFCCQYRISGLEYVLSRAPQIIVEAVNREGLISSKANISIPFK